VTGFQRLLNVGVGYCVGSTSQKVLP
jgi:hypothetical protein